MDVIYLFKVLIRRKRIILFCLALGLTGGLIFRLFIPRQYASMAQYSTGFSQTQKVSLRLTEIVDIGQIDFRINNVMETFKSPVVLAMVSYDLLLHDLDSDHPFRYLKEKQKRDTAYFKADISKARLILREKLNNLKLLSTYDPQEKMVWNLLNLYKYDEASILKKLTVERVPKTDYINVSFSSENPELSAYVSNEIGVKFKEFFISLTSTSTKESLFKLDSLRESKRKEVDTLRNRLEMFRDKIGTPNPGDAATAAMSGLQELTSSLTAQQASLNDYKQKLLTVLDQLRQMENTGPATGSSAEGNHAEEIMALRKTNDDLAARLAQKGGADPAIQHQIDDNINRINQFTRSSLPGINQALRAAELKQELIREKLDLQSSIAATSDNIEMYKGRVEQFRKIAFSGGGQEVIANAYQNDLSIAQRDLDKYNNSIFASQDIEVSPDFNFKQIMLGQPPIKAEPVKGLLIIAISGLSMFFLSALVIIILELLDASLRTPAIFQNETGMTVLSAVGKIDLDKMPLRDYFVVDKKRDRQQGPIPVDKKPLLDYFVFKLRDYIVLNKESGHQQGFVPFIENFRKLRYEIEKSGKRVILFTSTKTKEGKTTIIESLAHTFSMSRKKVLLIDANFSNNALTRDFSANAALESFVVGGQGEMDKIGDIIIHTSIPGVDIIGCEEGNYTPSEILPENNLFRDLDKLIRQYDYILMEGSALNYHADSKELTEYADGIVVVFSALNSLGEIDRESLEFLRENGSKFIGAVLNHVDEQNLDL
ncbi:MAG: Wzz/FepE/Etk N-terminal domain-containing protein [Bacteroidota bacterium]|nr:Wzz/FepE/Etk N-terminal domain-containing protein [Bacteroidota bacterium]MDP4210993.1 Wzz/FepE/Etk N-terminal domain-containing protein [Bacteroidota bacterium]MDP4248785.1 Wzz/FepE/Etk N-terminal domain-containing protein [Bacteroidota bacterium]